MWFAPSVITLNIESGNGAEVPHQEPGWITVNRRPSQAGQLRSGNRRRHGGGACVGCRQGRASQQNARCAGKACTGYRNDGIAGARFNRRWADRTERRWQLNAESGHCYRRILRRCSMWWDRSPIRSLDIHGCGPALICWTTKVTVALPRCLGPPRSQAQCA